MRQRRDLVTRFRAFKHRRSECDASVMRYWRNVKPGDGWFSRNFHVHFAVQGHPAGKADVGTARGLDCRPRHMRSNDLKLFLAAGCDVREALVHGCPRTRRGPNRSSIFSVKIRSCRVEKSLVKISLSRKRLSRLRRVHNSFRPDSKRRRIDPGNADFRTTTGP